MHTKGHDILQPNTLVALKDRHLVKPDPHSNSNRDQDWSDQIDEKSCQEAQVFNSKVRPRARKVDDEEEK
jgi:hypothetical protein